MAIVTGPLHSSEARGQIGGKTGLVYNTYRGRAYVKANALPTTEFSDLQIATRAIMNAVHARWTALSNADRSNWQDFADENHLCCWTGRLKQLSGWNWFAKVNFKLLQAGADPLSSPPFPITAYILEDLSSVPGIPTTQINWTPAISPPDPSWMLQIWSTAVHLPTVNPSFKLAHLVDAVLEQAGTFALATPGAGARTLYLVPLSTQGITMPPTRLIVTVT